MTADRFGLGTVVRARGREWIVLGGGDADTLHLRPVTGSEEDQTWVHLPLEGDPVTEATFPPPEPHHQGGQDTAMLLRDALLLSLRRGAGPFRGFGQIAVEPRAYQLVPLLMALKQQPVRLLVADDVGIGKTIEAALIARELLDRGDIERMTVLCPPHLVAQWVTELETRFHIRAEAVTAASARRVEADLPLGASLFTTFPFTVVSLDYIKSEKRRADFLRACPEFVVVDEAHTCAATGRGRHQRYELLRGLASDPDRHLVLLTATPHSGDDAAFHRLLGLLDPEFESLATAEGDERVQLRERLALHLVQRRRPDIDEWKEGKGFPKRETTEITYQLSGRWDQFFEHVLDYCAGIVEAQEEDEHQARLGFWGTLALIRCVSSSPAAAVQALRTRAGWADDPDAEQTLLETVFDGSSDALPDDDVETGVTGDDVVLRELVSEAEALAGQSGDPKLRELIAHLEGLLRAEFRPVVFCRYVATANYLGRHLGRRFSDVRVGVVTGELTPGEREVEVERLGDAERHLLVATDCLSEGVNLQHHFDAVVHYDLSWNPTRHEQREGRVDRFGQQLRVVRTTLLYGANNPVDGAVLEVIIRKANRIREQLGVPVPLPDDGHSLAQALMRAVLLRRRKRREHKQQQFDFAAMPDAKRIDEVWQDAAEKASRNRAIFAQRRMKPDEVLPEWHKSLRSVGGQDDVRRFADRALARLGGRLEKGSRGSIAVLDPLPEEVAERLAAEGLAGAVRVDFANPPAKGCRVVQRSHPLVAVLAETLLEETLSRSGSAEVHDPAVLGRVGCWVSGSVGSRTVVALLRLRHLLDTQRLGRASTLLVEEASAIAWDASGAPREETEALALLGAAPLADAPGHVRQRLIGQALADLDARREEIGAFAQRRAQVLLADHRRVRQASRATGTTTVRAMVPPDTIGLYVLLPKVE